MRAQTVEDSIARIPATLSPDEAAINKLLIIGYGAYAKRDAPTLLSLFSEQSPYFTDFKRLIEEDFTVNERSRINGLDARLVRNVQLNGDKATARLKVQIQAVDKETGQEVEGFGPMDHTFRLVRESTGWKIWQFVLTAEELASDLVAAKTDEERAAIMKTREPFTDGLLKGLSDQAAGLLERKGDDAHATIIFNLVLDAAQQVNSLLGRANALVGLGDVYLTQGDYLRAADNYQQVMTIAEKLKSQEGIAAVSVKLGNIHYYEGNFPQAMEYYQTSAKLYEKLGSTQEIAYPLLSIGNAYFAQNNYAQALLYFQQSLRVYEQIFDKAGTAYVLNRIAEVHAAQDRFGEALDFYQRSLRLQEELGLKSMTALSLNGIGDIRYREGNYPEAVKVASEATRLAREGNAPNILWKALTALGQAHLALRDLGQARKAFTGAIEVLEKLSGQLVGNEREQQLFFEDKTVPYVAMVELLIAQNRLAEAFHYAELAKGRVLLEVLRHGRADITKTMTDEERAREKQLNAEITSLGSQLRRESSLTRPDKARLTQIENQLQKARLEYEAYETRIYAAHPELKVERGEAKPITLADLKPLFRNSGTALLEYVVGKEKTYLFVLTKNGADEEVDIKVYTIAINAHDLADRAGSFRRQLANNSLDFKDRSRQLYDLLLLSAEKELAGKSTVCIVPAGALWELPFQALLSKAGKYFLEDHAVVYAPSLSVLREMKRRDAQRSLAGVPDANSAGGSLVKVSTTMVAPASSILAMGNPKLNADLVSRAKFRDRNLFLDDLPGAEREVKSLGEIYGAQHSKILTGSAAQETIVKADAWRYPILHFATHGVLDDYNPLYSRLLLASSVGNDDGFLEAREIMRLTLHADLAVLSACQTARGEVGQGEGLIGMSWAFFIAGASTTVVSQWKVDSESTARLMIDFHHALQGTGDKGGVSKAEALRRSALKMMSDYPKYRHPFYWSGFVVVGNGLN